MSADDPRTRGVAKNLANNLRALRETHGWTQARLAREADIPRPTLTHLESGSSNPTLHVLLRLCTALQVQLDELLGPPRDTGRHHPAKSLIRRTRTGVTVTELLPDVLPGLTVERLAFPVGKHMRGAPHTHGTREYLFCEQGSLVLEASANRWSLDTGDVVVFRGDQKHHYRNEGDEPAVGISVVLLPPPGS